MDEKKKKKESLDKTLNTAKGVLNDRVLSSAKDGVISDTLSYGATGIGMAHSINKELAGHKWKSLSKAQKSKVLKSSFLNRGVPIFALSGLAADMIVPSVRLHRLHNREFGENPDFKDYSKLVATKGIPSAVYFGALYKNRGKLVDSSVKVVKNLPKIIDKGLSKSDRKNALKVVGAGVGAGGSVQLLNNAAGYAQLIHTPETIIKSKKDRMKGVNDMNIKKAFNVVDDAFEKIAELENYDAGLEKISAEEIIDFGFDKIAAKKSMLKGVKDVLTGKNIGKAKGVMSATNAAVDGTGTASRVLNAVDGQLDNLLSAKQRGLKDLGKKTGVRIGKDGNVVKTRFSGKAEEELAKIMESSGKTVKQLSKEYGMSQKEISSLRKGLEASKGKIKPDREGILGVVDNVKNRGLYKGNAKKNKKIDIISERMKQGKNVSAKDLQETKRTLFGKTKVVGDSDFQDVVNKYNTTLGKSNKAKKNIARTKANIGDAQHELNAVKNSGSINNRLQAIRDAEKLKGTASSAKGVRNALGDIQDAAGFNVGETARGLAKANYNKEVAKTVGAYGAVGGAGYLGSKALSKDKQPEPYYGNSFQPQYNFNNRRDFVNRMAEEIVETAIIEKQGI